MGGVTVDPWDLLSGARRAVARRVCDEESLRRNEIVIALSGSHAFGFASPGSDVDLKAVHVAPVESLLGLEPEAPAADRLEVVDGVTVDFTSNELAAVLQGALKGNGNFLERVLGPTALVASPELASLREITRGALSRRVHRHYRGFATGQIKDFAERPTAKRLFYVLRTCLTGARLLRSGELVTELDALLDGDGFGDARALIAARRAGEEAAFDAGASARWRAEASRAMALLDEAHARSALPESPRDPRALHEWLVAFRRAQK